MNQERLMQVLLAPQISEKATFIAEKNEQVVFRVVSTATKPPGRPNGRRGSLRTFSASTSSTLNGGLAIT